MESLEDRYNRISSRHNLTAPPPAGVECDCDFDEGFEEHFHVRCMGASCDVCGDFFEEDYFVYTKEAGYDALAQDAEGRGWSVDRDANYYLCPQCSLLS